MLWAVHISDGMLLAPWLMAGFVLAGGLAIVGAWRIRDEEIPQVALLTAAFFIISLIHVPLGLTPVHLLLNGLLGVMLGRRVCLAIPVGLSLQAVLAQHGGYLSLGVNSCIMVLPALMAWSMFSVLQRVPWIKQPWFRSVLVSISVCLWTLSLIYSLALLFTNHTADLRTPDTTWADWLTFHPFTLMATTVIAMVAAWLEHQFENAPEFPIGLLIGTTSVLATALLTGMALLFGSHEVGHTPVLMILVAHVPIAVVEGMVLGFTVGFLVRVKPELLGWQTTENAACAVESLR